jgi:hypothetical protein
MLRCELIHDVCGEQRRSGRDRGAPVAVFQRTPRVCTFFHALAWLLTEAASGASWTHRTTQGDAVLRRLAYAALSAIVFHSLTSHFLAASVRHLMASRAPEHRSVADGSRGESESHRGPQGHGSAFDYDRTSYTGEVSD